VKSGPSPLSQEGNVPYGSEVLPAFPIALSA
jgi:hypothetical protein